MSAPVPLIAEQGQQSSGLRVSVQPLFRRPLVVCAIAFLAALVLVSIAAPLFAPYNPDAQDLTRVLSGPTAHNLLGTDTLGRDVLSRLIYGGRRSLLSIVEGLVVVMALGIPLGLAAGYAGGWVDRVLGRLGEMVMAIPAIVLILVVLAAVPHNEDVAMFTFGVLGTPVIMRVVRGATLQVRKDLYIQAARVSGLTHLRIVTRHILPRVMGPVVVQASLFSAYALLFETGIAYLGLTGNPEAPTWGGMIAEASTVIEQQSWLLFPPGILIALTILALGLLGNTIRDIAVLDDVAPSPRRAAPSRSTLTPAPIDHRDARPEPLIIVSDLEVVLRDRGGITPIVDAVSFEILRGETVGLVGESGCGKSVTALALLRLLPNALETTKGRVVWGGRDVFTMPESEFDRLRGSTFAYVSQDAQASLDPTFTVASQLSEASRHHDRVPRTSAKHCALELLRLVEFSEPQRVGRARAHELSGGMAQRVAIALALSGRPDLLIADEPTTALDVTVQAEILALLRRLQSETQMSLLLITHNWGVVADICDRTLVMYAGQIVEQSPVQGMFDAPLHPYTRGLLQSHPSLAVAHSHLRTVPGNVPSPGSWPRGCRFAPRCPHAAAECRADEIPLIAAQSDRATRCIRVNEIVSEVAPA